MTLIAVGKSSFLARAVAAKKPPGWVFLSHEEALSDTTWTRGADCVVNFAFSPRLRSGNYEASEDIDSQLLALTPAKYIMLSTRMVYGPAGGKLDETNAPQPNTAYGTNKLLVEQALQAKAADRVTILRLSNIFGHEYGRSSFFGHALTTLKDKGEIVFDMNPAQQRDFLSVWRFADMLLAVAQNPVAGVFNVGSGIGTACGDIATWLIEGFGAGRLAVNDSGKRDEFHLDTAKLRNTYALPVVTAEDIRQDCIAVGKNLAGL